jgi:hypothetical protein
MKNLMNDLSGKMSFRHWLLEERSQAFPKAPLLGTQKNPSDPAQYAIWLARDFTWSTGLESSPHRVWEYLNAEQRRFAKKHPNAPTRLGTHEMKSLIYAWYVWKGRKPAPPSQDQLLWHKKRGQW